MEIVTSFLRSGKTTDDSYICAQFHDCPIVPRVGEYVTVSTSRDEDGNYYEDGKATVKLRGYVSYVSYDFAQRGNSSDTNRKTLYVDVYLRDDSDDT